MMTFQGIVVSGVFEPAEIIPVKEEDKEKLRKLKGRAVQVEVVPPPDRLTLSCNNCDTERCLSKVRKPAQAAKFKAASCAKWSNDRADHETKITYTWAKGEPNPRAEGAVLKQPYIKERYR